MKGICFLPSADRLLLTAHSLLRLREIPVGATLGPTAIYDKMSSLTRKENICKFKK